MNDNLYRLIPEEGKHLANSHNTAGAFRGVYVDDKTNKVCGAGEFEKVDPSELTTSNDTNDNNESGFSNTEAAGKALLFGLLGLGLGLAYNKVKPHIERFWNTKIRKKDSIEIIDCKSENTDYSIGEVLSVDGVLEEYRENMSSEEAKKELIKAFFYLVMAARKINRVAQANIVDESGKIVDGFDLADKISNPAFIKEINAVLSVNPQLLSHEQVTELSNFLGYNIISEGKFIPFSSGTMREKLYELYI